MDPRICIACLLFSIASVAIGEDQTAPPTAPTAPQAPPFVVGDWYKVDAVRGAAREHFQGRLVKVNDRWIVLHARVYQKTSVPTLGDMPLVGTVF